MSELDNDELIATRRLNGLDDNLFKKSDKNVVNMTEEAFNELIDNFEVVEHLTPYGRKGIKENVKKLQARIKELEEDLYSANKIVEEYTDSIPVQKVKDKIEEYDKKMTENKGNPNWVVTDRIVMNVLEELLEEK